MAMTIKFVRSSAPKVVGKKGARVTGAKLARLKGVFKDHHSPKGTRERSLPVTKTPKPRCHIIGCYVGKNGTTCYYHCV